MKIIKKLLWIIWIPLIIVGIVLLLVGSVFVIGSYSANYGEDEYTKSVCDYESLEKFTITSDYKIVVADNDLNVIADKMNDYIEKIYGSKFTVVSSRPASKYIELKLGSNMGDVDYEFNSTDNVNIIITGNNIDHLLRACYVFIEEFGGYKCYTSKLYVKTQDAIKYPSKAGGYTKQYSDYFEMLDTDFISAKDDEYSWFRGFNTDEYRYQVKGKQSNETAEEAALRIATQNAYYDSLGGRVQYISSFCHTFASQFVSKDKYYKNGLELECYALDDDGNRRSDELCLTNERTYEIVLQEVKDILNSSNYNPDTPLQIISLTQADDLTACHCENCIKCAKEHGDTFAAPNLLFVNRIAKAIKEEGVNDGKWENVVFDTFAYRYTRTCPSDIVPEDNVIIRLCSIECCSSHYVDDSKCLTNVSFMKDLACWGDVCDRIYVWDYCTDFAHYMTVFPEIETLAHNLRVFYENGVKGVYEEGDYSLDKDGDDPEFAELRTYVISKVLQDPYCDYQKVIDDFCDAYYGEAGDLMAKFVRLTDKYAQRRHLNIYNSPDLILPCTQKEFVELEQIWVDAKAIATGDALQRVKNSECCWRYLKSYEKLYEFSDKDTFDAKYDELIADITALGQTRIREMDNYEQCSLQQTAIIDLHILFDLIVGNFIYGPF